MARAWKAGRVAGAGVIGVLRIVIESVGACLFLGASAMVPAEVS